MAPWGLPWAKGVDRHALGGVSRVNERCPDLILQPMISSDLSSAVSCGSMAQFLSGRYQRIRIARGDMSENEKKFVQ